jgi:vitamin B12 transporter
MNRFCMIAMAAAALQAQEVTLETLEVTAASRTAQNVQDVTESVTVITAEAIEEARVTTLQEALARLGRLPMTANGGPGQLTNVYLRGFDSRRALVLIDGVRYNDPTGLSGAQYEYIDLQNVARIEIIKGAQSGVWGADASAGVINIVTRAAQQGTHAAVDIQTGSFGTLRSALQLSHRSGGFDIQAGASRYITEGFSAAAPQKGSPEYGEYGEDLGWDRDAYASSTYTLELGYDLTERDRVEASYRYIDAHLEYDGGAGTDASNVDDLYGFGASEYFSDLDNRFYVASYRHDGELHDVTLQHSRSLFERSQYGGYSGEVSESMMQDRIAYTADAFLRIGASYQRFEHEQSAGSDLDEHYDSRAAFVTNHNRFDWFDALGATIVTESLRYDDYSAFDATTTGKVGVKQFFGTYFVSLNYGTGYNAPTLYHLYDGWSGNPNLKPEQTRSVDVTVGNDTVALTWFDNEINDMIDWNGMYTNLSGSSKIRGAELTYQDDFFDRIGVDATYTWLDAKNSEGEILGRRPKEQLDVAAGYYFSDAFDLSVDGHYVGERYDGNDKTGAQTGNYVVWNATANYRIDKNLTLYNRIDNLTDKYYQSVSGYATAERSFYIGLSARY